MDKIASPQDIQAELQKIHAYCGGQEPSRQVAAEQLRHLAARISTGSKDQILLDDADELLMKMDIVIRMMRSLAFAIPDNASLKADAKHAMKGLVEADASIRSIRNTLKKP